MCKYSIKLFTVINKERADFETLQKSNANRQKLIELITRQQMVKIS